MVAEILPPSSPTTVNNESNNNNSTDDNVDDDDYVVVVESPVVAVEGTTTTTAAAVVSVPPTPTMEAPVVVVVPNGSSHSSTDLYGSPTSMTRNHPRTTIEPDDDDEAEEANTAAGVPGIPHEVDAVPPAAAALTTTNNTSTPTTTAAVHYTEYTTVDSDVVPTTTTATTTTTTTEATTYRGRPPATARVTRSTTAVIPTSPMTTTTRTAVVPAVPTTPVTSYTNNPFNHRCINPASDINARLDTQVEVRVYPCNTSAGQKKKFTSFTIKPEGVIIQGSTRGTTNPRNQSGIDLGTEYATQIGRKLCRYELADTRACQLLVTTHGKNFWVVPAPEAFSRHSGTCRLLGDRKHPPAPHTMQVGDFLRVGSVGVVVIETHDGVTNCVLSEEKIQRIMKDTTATGGFLDLAETDGENSDDSMDGQEATQRSTGDASNNGSTDHPVCYMCFDEEDTVENPMITPCKCSGDTKYVHVECLRKWHTAEADNQICFLSSVDATCSVCKSTFKSDFKLNDGRQVKLFKSSLEPPYVSLLVATKHEMAQRLFNTRFQLSFSTLMKPDGKNATRPLLLGRSSGSDMVLDYRTVSARHAAIRFKNGEFVFTDAGSSNGSYLYLRRPLELSPSQAVQFRLGRSMISMKVVNKWNRRLLRAVRGQRSATSAIDDEVDGASDDRSIGSVDGDIRITANQTVEAVQRRTRDSVMASLPPPGLLSQSSAKHLDFLFALAYPKREVKNKMDRTASSHSAAASPTNHITAALPSTSPMATPVSPRVAVGTSNQPTPGPAEPGLENSMLPQEQATL